MLDSPLMYWATKVGQDIPGFARLLFLPCLNSTGAIDMETSQAQAHRKDCMVACLRECTESSWPRSRRQKGSSSCSVGASQNSWQTLSLSGTDKRGSATAASRHGQPIPTNFKRRCTHEAPTTTASRKILRNFELAPSLAQSSNDEYPPRIHKMRSRLGVPFNSAL